jgi:hypothetical protein
MGIKDSFQFSVCGFRLKGSGRLYQGACKKALLVAAGFSLRPSCNIRLRIQETLHLAGDPEVNLLIVQLLLTENRKPH